MGSNDYLNNYLMPNYPTRNQYNAQEYAHLLAQTYNTQLTEGTEAKPHVFHSRRHSPTAAVNALMGMIAFNGNYEFNPVVDR
ncbi:hypothetical protein HN51_009767 [Arachis hypogaea]